MKTIKIPILRELLCFRFYRTQVTRKIDVEEALTNTEYAAGDVVPNIKLDDYQKITKANLGSKVYLVAKTKNFRNGATVKFKIFESGDKLLSEYVDNEDRLPFLQGTTQKVDTVQPITTEDVDNPETGNVLEGRAVIEIALRPKKEKPTDENDTSANLEAWKEKFKKAEGETEEKKDKLYLKVSSISYPEIVEKAFLVGDELVVRGGGGCITKEMFKAISLTFNPTDDFINYTNEYAKKFNVCTPLKIAHFIAQIAHESQSFTKTVEGMYYNEKAFLKIYKDTKTPNGVDFNNVNTYKHLLQNPTALANWRYGYINKNNQQVDHRGRGYIHITWKANYEAYTTYYQSEHNDTTIDFTETPKKLENMPYAMEAAFYYWHTRCLGKTNVGNKVIEDSNLTMNSSLSEHLKVVKKVTKAVNGGDNGLPDREDKFTLIFNYLKEIM